MHAPVPEQCEHINWFMADYMPVVRLNTHAWGPLCELRHENEMSIKCRFASSFARRTRGSTVCENSSGDESATPHRTGVANQPCGIFGSLGAFRRRRRIVEQTKSSCQKIETSIWFVENEEVRLGQVWQTRLRKEVSLSPWQPPILLLLLFEPNPEAKASKQKPWGARFFLSLLCFANN